MRSASAPFGPAYAHDGEHDRLADERRELFDALSRLPPHSRLRPGLEYRLRAVTTRLLIIGPPVASPPGSTRRDLQ